MEWLADRENKYVHTFLSFVHTYIHLQSLTLIQYAQFFFLYVSTENFG